MFKHLLSTLASPKWLGKATPGRAGMVLLSLLLACSPPKEPCQPTLFVPLPATLKAFGYTAKDTTLAFEYSDDKGKVDTLHFRGGVSESFSHFAHADIGDDTAYLRRCKPRWLITTARFLCIENPKSRFEINLCPEGMEYAHPDFEAGYARGPWLQIRFDIEDGSSYGGYSQTAPYEFIYGNAGDKFRMNGSSHGEFFEYQKNFGLIKAYFEKQTWTLLQ